MRSKTQIIALTAVWVGVLATGSVLVWKFRTPKVEPNKAAFSQKKAEVYADVQKAPKDFIAKNENSPDAKVQTMVTRARMVNAYDTAKKKDFGQARAEFMEASYKHKGTDVMNPDYGTLPDQAAYQAIVCLDAAGKKDEAKHEYRKFMLEHKTSPLIHACFRRLERINGKSLPEDEALLQAGMDEQNKRIRFETSVCGPKSLEKILPLLGKEAKSYKELAKVCGTNDEGTSLSGLKKGAESLGLKAYGMDLNAEDFSSLKKPFLWLQADHFLAVLEIKDGQMHLYDSRFNYDEWKNLPARDNAQFRASVLAFEVPTTDIVADHKPSKKS